MPRSKYEADNGDIRPITLSAARLAVAGTPPGGDIDNIEDVTVSKTRRQHGTKPRYVVLSREVEGATEPATKSTMLPVLTPTAFASAAFAEGATVTYGGFDWEIVGKVGEQVV